MSIELQFAPTPKVTEPNPAPSELTSDGDAQGSEWRTILEGLFQSEPEIATDGEDVVPGEPSSEPSPTTPLSAIAFLASFFSKEAPNKLSLFGSTVEPQNDEGTAGSEIGAEPSFLPTEAPSDPPSSSEEFELAPNQWEFVPVTILTPAPFVAISERSPHNEIPSSVGKADQSPYGTHSPAPSGSAPDKRGDPQIVSAVFTIKTGDAGADTSGRPTPPNNETVLPAADEIASAVPVRLGGWSQETPTESGEKQEARDELQGRNQDVLPEDTAPAAGEALEVIGGNLGFSTQPLLHPGNTRNRTTEARLSTLSFVSQVDAAMADPVEPARLSSINLDLRISRGDLGLPADLVAGELRLQLRQRGEEIQMRVHGSGEGISSRAQSGWAGLVERLRPQGLETERTHFAVIPVSRDPHPSPPNAVETMQREGSGNSDAEGQRRQHDRDQRQEQHRNQQERARRENETKIRFSSFLSR